MIVIVDSNILFSALLAHKSIHLDTLENKAYEFFAPNFIFTEIFKYKEKILKHSKLTEIELLEVLNNLFARIQLVPHHFISLSNRKKASELCENIDSKDAVFVALTIELNGLLWTGDKKLKTGLAEKGFQRFFTNNTNIV